MTLLRKTPQGGGVNLHPISSVKYWAESGKTRPKVDLLSVYHDELSKWTLSVYKLLIARKKVGKPRTTSWYLIKTDVSDYHSASVDCRGRRTSHWSVRAHSIGAGACRHWNCFSPRRSRQFSD